MNFSHSAETVANVSFFRVLLCMYAVAKTDALTMALELDNPEAGGILPDSIMNIPEGSSWFIVELLKIPLTPHSTY
uniref:Putative secreted protein n=1 Tax=Anopheles triannulatus TaxID=58253 RepID=A0A2M4B6Y2_9DIPT